METCCHTNTSERPSANFDVKNSNEKIIIIIIIIIIMIIILKILLGNFKTNRLRKTGLKTRHSDKIFIQSPTRRDSAQGHFIMGVNS